MRPYLSAVLILLSTFAATAAEKREPVQHVVKIAIGEPGSESFVFGTELWAMSQIALKPAHGIDLTMVEVANEDDRLARLRMADVEAALFLGEPAAADTDDMRMIMAIRPEGNADGAEPARLLARKDVADEVIYAMTRAIFENPNFFRNTATTTIGSVNARRVASNVGLPIHPGASRYYQERNIAMGFRPKSADLAHFTNFDDDALSQDERSQVAAACREALEYGALSAVLGDLSSRGCEVYQSFMIDQPSSLTPVDSALNDPFAISVGQGGPAIALDDVVAPGQAVAPINGLLEARNSPRQPIM